MKMYKMYGDITLPNGIGRGIFTDKEAPVFPWDEVVNNNFPINNIKYVNQLLSGQSRAHTDSGEYYMSDSAFNEYADEAIKENERLHTLMTGESFGRIPK